MKRTITILIAVITATATNLLAQQVIEFKALSAPFHILKWQDVDAILDAEWNGGEFIAEIDPEITVIGSGAFSGYKYPDNETPTKNHLVKVNTRNVETIDVIAFAYCTMLQEIVLPLVTTINARAFAFSFMGEGNKTAIFGEGFTSPTTIIFCGDVFGGDTIPITTPSIALTVTANVLPQPDTVSKIWNGTPSYKSPPYYINYVWKSINVVVGIEEDEEKMIILYLGNNTYYIDSDDILEFELFDLLGNQVKKYNSNLINLNNLQTSGIYFLRCSNRKKIKIEKLIRY